MKGMKELKHDCGFTCLIQTAEAQAIKQNSNMLLFSLHASLASFLSSSFPFFLHRKACTACGCSTVDHAPGGDLEDDQRMGRLLADSPCSHLTAKVKGGGGLRMYKRNRMIVTNPVVSRKDPTFNTTTYDWAPAGLNQKLVRVTQDKFYRSQNKMQDCSVFPSSGPTVHSPYCMELHVCFPLRTGRSMFQVLQPIIMMMTVIIEWCSVVGE